MLKQLFISMGILLSSSAAIAQEALDIEAHTFWRTEGERRALQTVIDRLSNEDLKVNIVEHEHYNTLRQAVSSRIGLGFPPEISHWIGGEDLAGLSKIGEVFLRPNTQYTDRIKELVYPEVLGEISSDGNIYAIPMGIHLQHSVIYNKKIMQSVDVEGPPKTWEEFFAFSQMLEKQGIATYAGTTELWVVRELFNGVMASIGQRDLLNKIYDGRIGTPSTKKQLLSGLDKFLKLRNMLDNGAENRNWSDMVKMVIDGEAAMTIIGDFAWSEIKTFAKDGVEQFACAGLPGKGSAFFGVDIFVSFNTGVGLWAEKFTSFQETVLNKETQVEYLSYKGGLPVLKGIDPTGLNPCSKSSLQRWNDNPDQRYSSPGTRDSNKTAMVNVALSKIWNDRSVGVNSAYDILNLTISPVLNEQE